MPAPEPPLAERVPVMRWDRAANAWRWIDDTRDRREAPPNIEQIVSAAIKTSSLARVSEALGLSRQTCAAIGGGFQSSACTFIVAGMRLANIARITEELGEP